MGGNIIENELIKKQNEKQIKLDTPTLFVGEIIKIKTKDTNKYLNTQNNKRSYIQDSSRINLVKSLHKIVALSPEDKFYLENIDKYKFTLSTPNSELLVFVDTYKYDIKHKEGNK